MKAFKKKFSFEYFLPLALLAFSPGAFSLTIQIPAPKAMKELKASKREYKDCIVENNLHPRCPSGSPENYGCHPGRESDILGEESEVPANMIRLYLLGHPHQRGAFPSARKVGENCVEETTCPSLNSPQGCFPKAPKEKILKLVKISPSPSEGTSPMRLSALPLIPITAKTPQTFHPEIDESIFRFGCASHTCKKSDKIPFDKNKPYAQYKCAPRLVCRCLEAGEKTPSEKACCSGLKKGSEGVCVKPEMELQGLDLVEGLPLHVSPSSGLFNISDDIAQALELNIVNLKALEYYASGLNKKEHCLPDIIKLKEVGDALNKLMTDATIEYNKDFIHLEGLKKKFLEYSKAVQNPRDFFKRQSTVMYRGKPMSEEEFVTFVRSASSGAEIFNLMADELRLQIKYEHKVFKGLEKIYNDINFIKDEFWRINPNSRTANYFNASYNCSRINPWRFLALTQEYKIKNTWRSRYNVGLDVLAALRTRGGNFEESQLVPKASPVEAEFFKSYLEFFPVGRLLFERISRLRSLYLIEPLVSTRWLPKKTDYGSYGVFSGGIGSPSLWSWGRKRPRNLSYLELKLMMEEHKEGLKRYYQKNYYEQKASGKELEILDIPFGATRECFSEETEYGVKGQAKSCARFLKAMKFVHLSSFSQFLLASYGSSHKYEKHVFIEKSTYYLTQALMTLELRTIYNHLSNIPKEYGGLNFFDKSGQNYKEIFDELNEKVPGYLRFKSYLFLKAKAKEIEDNKSEHGIKDGVSPDELKNLYGSPAQLISTHRTNLTGSSLPPSHVKPLRISRDTRATGSGISSKSSTPHQDSSLASVSIAQADYKKELAKLNKRHRDFIKKNPHLKKDMKKLSDLHHKSRLSAMKAMQSPISSLEADSAKDFNKGPKATISQKDSASKDGKEISEKEGSPEGKNSSRGRGGLYRGGTYTEGGSYTEKDTTEGSLTKHLTSLSDRELQNAIRNVKDQGHLFSSQAGDTLFEKISKTYARSYHRFLRRKTDKKERQNKPDKETSSKLRSLLDEY